MTGRHWVDWHFLPDYFHPQPRRYDVARVIRLLAGAGGLAIIVFLRPYVGNAVMVGRGRELIGRTVYVVAAAVLALLVSEAVLRTALFRPRHASPAEREPHQQANARLGWTLVPNRVGHRFVGGRTIDYAMDALGRRVPCAGCVVDVHEPSILFIGESIMLGTGLRWEESVPAQVGSMLGARGVNLAVEGYATDQAYLRLSEELPRFSHPVAVVALFMPSLLPRNLKVDRPHLDSALHWQPAVIPWRLHALANRVLNYSSTADVDRGIAMTRAVLQATARLAQSRQAKAVVLVPRFPPESSVERELRHRIFDDSGIDYVLVDLDPSWRLPDDAHPDARGAREMAAAVADRLRAMRSGELERRPP